MARGSARLLVGEERLLEPHAALAHVEHATVHVSGVTKDAHRLTSVAELVQPPPKSGAARML